MRKTMVSLILVLSMCASFCVPAFASHISFADNYDVQLAETMQTLNNVSVKTLVIDGKDATFTSGYDEFGRSVVVVDNGEVQAIVKEKDSNSAEVLRLENGVMTTHQYTYSGAEECAPGSIQPRITISGSDLYWGYSYSVGDAEEEEEGLLWDLECGSPLYDTFYGYDDNDSTARAYAEDFMDYVNSMEANQRDARTINANAVDNFFVSIISICTDPTQVLAAIASSNASVRAAEDAIYKASQDAKQALYCFRRFTAIAAPLFP